MIRWATLLTTSLLSVALLGVGASITPDPGGDLVYVDLIVNAAPHGEALAAITDDDVLVLKKDLDAVGLSFKQERIRTFEGRAFVSLASLAPSVSYDFDDTTFALNIQADVSVLPSSSFHLGTHPEAPLDTISTRAGFLNYALIQSSGAPLGYSGQLGYSTDRALATSTFFSDSGAFRRGDTYLENDDLHGLVTTTIGDAFVPLGTFAGSPHIAGVTVQRRFALDPYLLRFPSPAIFGSVTSPSRAEVYVNGVLTRVIDLQPGTFTFNDLPTVAGINNTVVLLRDAFGNVRELNAQDYSSLDLLAKGLSDFAVTAGALRHDVYLSRDSYQGAAAGGRYAYGFTNNFTAGVRGETGPNVVSGGVSATLAGRLGALGVGFSQSRAYAVNDSALQLAFDYQSLYFGFSALSAQMGPHYATTTLTPADDRTLLAQSTTISFGLSQHGGVTFGIGRSIDRDNGTSAFTSASLYRSLTAHISLAVTAQRNTSTNAAPSQTFVAQAIVRTGPRTTTTLSAGNTAAGATVSWAPESTFGTSYSFSGYTDGSGFQDIRVVGQPATLEFTSLKSAGSSPTYSAAVAGSLVAADHHILAGRPISDGFIVIDGAGSHSDVLLNGQAAGVTGNDGVLLVPTVTAYAENRVSIDGSGEPINESIERPTREFTTRSFGGGVLHFAMRRVEHLYLLRLRVQGAENDVSQVAFAPITLASGHSRQTTQLDGDGNFSIDTLAPGTYEASANIRGTPCTLTIALPPSNDFQIDLGTLSCRLSPSSSP